MTEKDNQKHYYRFGTFTELGKQFRRWWNEFNKAQRAKKVFLEKIGAEEYTPEEQVYDTGVKTVTFPRDKQVDERIWRCVRTETDGTKEYVPNVMRRTGYMVLPRKGFRPSDTATRVYDKRLFAWPEAAVQYTLKEWAKIAGVSLTGDEQTDRQRVNEAMQHSTFAHYTDFYHPDYDPADPERQDKRARTPWWAREAVRIEVQRVSLPKVRLSSYYRMLQAQQPAVGMDAQGVQSVQEVSPIFFEWAGKFYCTCSRSCQHPDIEEISTEGFSAKMVVAREAEQIGKREERGS
jgi:hypothetical protein